MSPIVAQKDLDLLQFDKDHLWHPYTSMTSPLKVYLVESAKGVRLHLQDGRELIDGMASWWSVIHGYNHPELTRAVKQQAEQLSHVMFGGLTHEPAIKLGHRLVEVTPSGLDKVFFCDSGSVAVEVAMKMAIQYSYNQKTINKNKFLTIRSGYHGDTFHCMSVCDPVNGMHKLYDGILPSYYFADKPAISYHQQWDPADLDPFLVLANKHKETICAVIMEPIVQGAGGMRFYHPNYLKGVRKICDEYGILLIADEIATGFGRSGKLFGCDHAKISPDIMCLGKALTGGYMSLAAVLATEDVANGISENEPGVFMHGPTFMGNPLACSVALTSLTLLNEGETEWEGNVLRLERRLQDGLAPCADMKGVREVRVLGGIGVVELDAPVDMGRIQEYFVEEGVWVRPFGKLVYVMPPYVMNDEDLMCLTSAMVRVIEKEVSCV